MLQYDLTQTPLFDSVSREELPTEAEMFGLTVALLLVRDAAYGDLVETELLVSEEDITALAECIEYRLSPLARDFGAPDRLRHRLRWFVGLRVTAMLPDVGRRKPKPTGVRQNSAAGCRPQDALKGKEYRP
jgi:hypothetical protein